MKNTKKKGVHGQKMLELRTRFFSNDIADEKGYVLAGNVWECGVVYLHPNDLHEIGQNKAEIFHSMAELPSAIEKVLIKNKVIIHRSKRTKKYNA